DACASTVGIVGTPQLPTHLGPPKSVEVAIPVPLAPLRRPSSDHPQSSVAKGERERRPGRAYALPGTPLPASRRRRGLSGLSSVAPAALRDAPPPVAPDMTLGPFG